MTDTTAAEYSPVADATLEAPSLGIQDIENALKIIDFASEQGAFKGWTTIRQVMDVRDKIATFVNYAKANADPAAEAPAEPVANAAAE
jgi:hypothetical protein